MGGGSRKVTSTAGASTKRATLPHVYPPFPESGGPLKRGSMTRVAVTPKGSHARARGGGPVGGGGLGGPGEAARRGGPGGAARAATAYRSADDLGAVYLEIEGKVRPGAPARDRRRMDRRRMDRR